MPEKSLYMNQQYFLAFALLVFWINTGISQNITPSEFIPDGYVLFEKFSGDLNKDDRKDYVLIIKDTKEENVVENHFGNKVDRNRRGIVIILSQKSGYNKVLENRDCFSSENEDGGVYMPPELWIDIKDGKLKIHYGHGRYGYWQYVFKYMNSDFNLIGYESSESHGPKVLYKTKLDFLNKEKRFSENINKTSEAEEEVFEVVSSKIKINRLIKLSEIKEFEELDMTQF